MGILIASAPRSGSSCLSGLIQLHGFSLGKDVATVKDEFNEKGYFENEKILNFNRMVLDEIGADVFIQNQPSAPEKMLNFSDKLKDLCLDQYSDQSFSIKDPRIAILQDLYLDVFPLSKVILLRRDVDDVSRSICRMRPNLSLNDAKVTCVEYSLLLDSLRDKADTMEVCFEDVLSDPVSSVGGLCEWLGIEFQKESVLSFIDRKLVHFEKGSSNI